MTKDEVKAIEQEGWRIVCEQPSHGCHFVELEILSPKGEDVVLSFTYDKDNTLAMEVMNAYENFDVDYEVYVWLGEDGHGRNGAPYHIREILEDKEWQERKLEQLAIKLGHLISSKQ